MLTYSRSTFVIVHYSLGPWWRPAPPRSRTWPWRAPGGRVSHIYRPFAVVPLPKVHGYGCQGLLAKGWNPSKHRDVLISPRCMFMGLRVFLLRPPTPPAKLRGPLVWLLISNSIIIIIMIIMMCIIVIIIIISSSSSSSSCIVMIVDNVLSVYVHECYHQ